MTPVDAAQRIRTARWAPTPPEAGRSAPCAVLCSVTDAGKVMETIRASPPTGKIGDGNVWIVDVDRLMRIRTGDMDLEAT